MPALNRAELVRFGTLPPQRYRRRAGHWRYVPIASAGHLPRPHAVIAAENERDGRGTADEGTQDHVLIAETEERESWQS